MSNIIVSGTTFQNDLNAANIAANTARTQANIATIAAVNAASSASRAATFAGQAQNSAINASNSASLAATYATAARTATGNVTNTSVTNQPAGSNGWVQFRSGNGFSGSSNLTFVNNSLNVSGTLRAFTANIPSIVSTQINASSISANYVSSNAISVFGNSSFTQSLNIFGNLSVVGTISGNGASLSGVAPLNSPTFTGTPLAPTAGSGTNNTQVATTAFVSQAIANLTGIIGSFSITGNINTANNVIASGVLTSVGNVTGGNLRTTGIVTATGNITTAGNLTVGGTVQSTGNVIVARLISIGNVSGTNFSANGNAVVTGNVLSSGNITAINLVANSSINTQNANVFNTLSVAGGIKQNQFTKLGNSTGQPGQIVWDTNYIYVCTATNVWKRVALTSF